MADYYCDHGAYPAYASIPTWGVAQEGDGTTKDIAIPAIASIVINAPAAAGNTITIMGVVLTAVASAPSSAQFLTAASASLQADSIATAINLAQGQVALATSNTRHQLRNMVYARGPSSGAPANTVQIMTRCGSSKMNFSANTGVEITSAGFSAAPTISHFSGGVGGVFGYQINDEAKGTIWPQQIAKFGYGALYSEIGKGPLSGSNFIQGDFLHLRGNGKSVFFINGASTTLAMSISATILVDDGTVWPGDSGGLSWVASPSYLGTIAITGKSGIFVTLAARDINKFTISNPATTSVNIVLGPTNAAGAQYLGFKNINLFDAGAGGSITIGQFAVPGGSFECSNLILNVTTNKFYSPIYGLAAQAGTVNINVEISKCVFNFPNFTGTPATALVGNVSYLGNTQGNSTKVLIKDCKVNVPNKPYVVATAIPSSASPVPSTSLVIENITGALPYSSIGLFGSNTGTSALTESSFALQQSVGASRQFKFESHSKQLEWSPGDGYPTLDCFFADNTLWSLAVSWVGSSMAYAIRKTGTEFFSCTLVSTTEGMQTLTAEIMIDPLILQDINQSHISISAMYTDTLGAVNSETTQKNDWETALAIQSSTKIWEKNNYPGYVAAKIPLTLSKAIKAGSEVSVVLKFHKPNPTLSGSVIKFFLNPDVGLS
jgi:hypothetical protein